MLFLHSLTLFEADTPNPPWYRAFLARVYRAVSKYIRDHAFSTADRRCLGKAAIL